MIDHCTIISFLNLTPYQPPLTHIILHNRDKYLFEKYFLEVRF